MRKLKLQTQVSVDGFMAGPNGEMDWMLMNWSEDLVQYVTAFTEPIDTIVMGRKLAEGFIPYWNSNPDQPGASTFNNSKKVVFTRTLDKHEWPNTELAKGDLTETINQLKAEDGGDIVVYGGSNFVSNLIENNLIDEYHLFLNPTLAGNGLPIFKSEAAKRGLKLVKTTPTECGIVVLHYAPEK